eukprot:365517-Chlamydomonas_euryale.AAC.2
MNRSPPCSSGADGRPVLGGDYPTWTFMAIVCVGSCKQDNRASICAARSVALNLAPRRQTTL